MPTRWVAADWDVWVCSLVDAFFHVHLFGVFCLGVLLGVL